MINLKDLSGLFSGETLHLLLGFQSQLPTNSVWERSISLGIGSAIYLCPNSTFWSSDNISRDWPAVVGRKDLIPKCFVPIGSRLGEIDTTLSDSLIPFEPFPVGVLPRQELDAFMASTDRGNKIPVSWGPIALAVGIAYVLDFSGIVVHGNWAVAEKQISPEGIEIPISDRDKDEWGAFWRAGEELSSKLGPVLKMEGAESVSPDTKPGFVTAPGHDQPVDSNQTPADTTP